MDIFGSKAGFLMDGQTFSANEVLSDVCGCRVLLHSGSGFINFVFGIIIYLTALFYLLSNSSAIYKPMDILAQYVPYQGSG